MPTIYHLMPRNLVGNVLYPLKVLQQFHPETYEKHAGKYQGREAIMDRQIPILNCLWNDVLFFSPVHPQAIRQGFIDAGNRWKPQQWYAVDTSLLDFTANNTVIYYPDVSRKRGDFTLQPDRFVAFDPERLATIYELPEPVLNYYREATENGEPIFAWMGSPHVLHRGALPLDRVDLVEV